MSTESTPVPETKEKTSFQIVRRGQLAAGHVFDWDDPEKLAPLNPQKYQTWLTNPLADNDEDPVQIIGLLGRRVIGKIDLLAGRCQIDGRETPILWTVNCMSPSNFAKP